MNEEMRWLEWAIELQSLAQAGLAGTIRLKTAIRFFMIGWLIFVIKK